MRTGTDQLQDVAGQHNKKKTFNFFHALLRFLIQVCLNISKPENPLLLGLGNSPMPSEVAGISLTAEALHRITITCTL